jgi:hypothetical protein
MDHLRHSRECGNPFLTQQLKFKLDSRVRGNDGVRL